MVDFMLRRNRSNLMTMKMNLSLEMLCKRIKWLLIERNYLIENAIGNCGLFYIINLFIP